MRRTFSGVFLAVALVGSAFAAEPRKINIPDAPMLPVASAKILTGPPDKPIGPSAGIAHNSKGHYFLYQRTANALMEFDANDNFVREFPNAVGGRAHGLRIDPSDNIWLTNVNDHTVTKLSPTGDVLLTLGTKGKAGTWDEAAGAHLFTEPNDIGFAANGDVFVITGHGGPDPRIVKFDKTGKFLKTWSLAHEDGSKALTHTIVMDKAGLLYIGDRDVMTIRVFDAEGKNLRNIKMNNLVCGLHVDTKGNLWMVAGFDGMIQRLDWSGKVLAWTGKAGKGGANEYGEAHYMTVSQDLKSIYVTDPVNPSSHKISLSKAFE